MPVALGTAVGLGLSLTWIFAAYGGIDGLLDAFRARTGSEEAGFAEALDRQRFWLVDLLGPALVALGASVLALADRRYRSVAAVLLVSTVGWAVLLPNGAAIHSYWLFWIVVPVAFGAAWLADTVAMGGPLLPALTARARSVAVGGLALAALSGVVVVSLTEEDARAGERAGSLITGADALAAQADLPYVGMIGPPPDWMRYDIGLDGVDVSAPGALEDLAETHPDDLVLVTDWCAEGESGRTCRALSEERMPWERSYQLIPAAVAAERIARR